MILILLSFYAGIGGGMFEVQGNDIVDESYGPGAELFMDIEMVPHLVYSFSISGGRAGASTETTMYDTLGNEYIQFMGENFEYLHGNLTLRWFPLSSQINPYVSARLGFMRWRFKDNGSIVTSLTGNEYDRYSLSLGGGGGLAVELADFIVYAGAYSDFIFSVDNEWEKGFGPGDDNEYTIGFELRIGREF